MGGTFWLLKWIDAILLKYPVKLCIPKETPWEATSLSGTTAIADGTKSKSMYTIPSGHSDVWNGHESAVIQTIETVSPEGTFCDTVQIPSSVGDMELI